MGNIGCVIRFDEGFEYSDRLYDLIRHGYKVVTWGMKHATLTKGDLVVYISY